MHPSIGPLSEFLALNRSKYLDALKIGKGQDWTVVVGNEAGDLDSAASSIAYSYLASTLLHRPTVALLQTSRPDLQLRAENLYAYEIARLHPCQDDLLCIDDIPPESFPGLSSSLFALIDHNRLAPRFSAAQGLPHSPKVSAIIDHHEDEGDHEDANPRVIVVPVGSCASLVTRFFTDPWNGADASPPKELASLLLCAIFIDTDGLKPRGKAVSIDYDAAAFLLSKSTFASSSDLNTESVTDHKEISKLIRTLDERKQSVTHLSSRDLLRRDYKEYTFESSPRSSLRAQVGLATVPLSPKTWLRKEASPKFWESMDAWILERGLDALGVLFTYNSKSGQHKRQILWVVKRGCQGLKKALWEGMETSEELKLERKNMEKRWLSEGTEKESDGDVRTVNGGIARIWKQGNVKATRKVVAPVVKNIIKGI